MTRQDVLKLFPTASEDSITAILNMHNTEVENEKTKNKADAKDKETIKNLQEQLEALQNKDLSEVDKLQKQIDKLTADNEQATRTIRNMEMKTSIIGQGISAEDADQFIEQMGKDSFDAGILGEMIKNAVAKKEKDALHATPNPSGTKGGTDKRSDAEKLAATLYSGDNKQQDILSNYTK